MIYHLVPTSAFRAATAAGVYRPQSLASDRFIHCAATPTSVLAVAHDYFGATEEPVLVLAIDPARLAARVVFEAPAPVAGGGTSHLDGASVFPHVYGPIELSAVTGAALLTKRDGRFVWPACFEPVDTIPLR